MEKTTISKYENKFGLGANPITVINYDDDCFALVLKRSDGHMVLIVVNDRS